MNNKIKSISEHTGLAVYALGLDREKFERALTRYTESIVKECIELLPEDCQSKNGHHTSWVIKELFGIQP
jgi:hypothetical protein